MQWFTITHILQSWDKSPNSVKDSSDSLSKKKAGLVSNLEMKLAAATTHHLQYQEQAWSRILNYLGTFNLPTGSPKSWVCRSKYVYKLPTHKLQSQVSAYAWGWKDKQQLTPWRVSCVPGYYTSSARGSRNSHPADLTVGLISGLGVMRNRRGWQTNTKTVG